MATFGKGDLMSTEEDKPEIQIRPTSEKVTAKISFDVLEVPEEREEGVQISLGAAADKFQHFVKAESKHKAIIDKIDIDEDREDGFKMLDRMVRLESVASRLSVKKEMRKMVSLQVSQNINQ